MKLLPKILTLIVAVGALVVSGCGGSEGKVVPRQASSMKPLPIIEPWVDSATAVGTLVTTGNWKRTQSWSEDKVDTTRVKIQLAKSFTIADKNDADKALTRYTKNGLSAKYRELLQTIKIKGWTGKTPEELQNLLSETADPAKSRIMLVYTLNQQKLKSNPFIAWDLCHAMELIKECYAAGYYSREEAEQRMLGVALKLQQTYTSWEEMLESYYIGCQFTYGNFTLTPESKTMEFKQAYQKLKAEQDGPFTMAWDTPLGE